MLGIHMDRRYFECVWNIERKSLSSGKSIIKTSKIEISAQGVPKKSNYDSSEWKINNLVSLIIDCNLKNIWFNGNFQGTDRSFFHCLRAGGQDIEQNSRFPKKLLDQFEEQFPGATYNGSRHKHRIMACVTSSGKDANSYLDLLIRSNHPNHESNNCAKFTSVRIKYCETGYTYEPTNSWDTGPSGISEEFSRFVEWNCEEYPQNPMKISSTNMDYENTINYVALSSIPNNINVRQNIRSLGKNTEMKIEWNSGSGFSHKETQYHDNTWNCKIHEDMYKLPIKFPGGEEFILDYKSKFTALGLEHKGSQSLLAEKSFNELNYWLNNGQPINDGSNLLYIVGINDERAIPRWPITISEKRFIKTVHEDLGDLRKQIIDNVDRKILIENIQTSLEKLRKYHDPIN